jgi:UDP-glucose 4-epimerase
VNVTGTLNVLDACVKEGVGRFIFSSSASVYGEPSELPLKEDSPVRPLSPYAASKPSAEHYINVYHRVYGLNTVILRIFNVYGCGQPLNDYSGVIAKFLGGLSRVSLR